MATSGGIQADAGLRTVAQPNVFASVSVSSGKRSRLTVFGLPGYRKSI